MKLLLATKAAAAITLIALLSTEPMNGLVGDVKDAVFTPAHAAAAIPEKQDVRVRVGEVLYTADGQRLGAIRAIRSFEGEYRVIYLANAVFVGDDVSIVDGRLQLRDIDFDLAELSDQTNEAVSGSLATLLR